MSHISGSDKSRAHAFLKCLTHDEDGLWTVTPRSQGRVAPRRWFSSSDDLISFVVGDRWGAVDYFVPSPFVTQQRNYEAWSGS